MPSETERERRRGGGHGEHRSANWTTPVASLLCSLAPSVELLVLFRLLQAVGASMLNPIAMSITGRARGGARNRPPPNATVLVDDLESLGLVRRRPDPTDRRAKVVEATRKGKTMARQADAILGTPPPALSRLDGEDLEALRRILRSIRASKQEPADAKK